MRRLLLLTGITFALATMFHVQPAAAVQCNPDIDYCGSDGLDFTYDSFAVTSQGFSFRLLTVSRITYGIYACLGSMAQCSTVPITDSLYWHLVANGVDDTLPRIYSYNNLRPNTKYPNLTIRISDPPSANPRRSRTMEFTNIITHPAFTPQTTVQSNLQPTSATISWTSAFSGNSQVVYGLQPPQWVQEPSPIDVGDAYVSIAPVGRYDAWAATFGGGLLHRTISGWSAPVYPDSAQHRQLRSLDMVQPTSGWAVGLSAGTGPLILRTTNGTSWSIVTPPAGLTTNLYDVHSAISGTAWAVGEGQRIFFYNGSAWIDRTPSFANSISAYFHIYSSNDRFVLAGGLDGSIARSSDGGSNWAQIALPNGVGVELTGMTSRDGQTIWVSGRTGKLWKSTDAGSTWTQQFFVSPGDEIWSIAMADDHRLWVGQSSGVGVYDGSSYVVSNTIASQTGGLVRGIAPLNNADVLAIAGSLTFEYSMFGTAVNGPASSTPAITLSGLSSALPPGQNYHYAAFTTAGQVSGGITDSLILPLPDTIPPTITFTTPTTTIYTRVATFTTSGLAQDNQGLSSVGVTLNGAAQAVTTAPDVSGTPTNTTWSSNLTLQPGANTIVATATDTSNNAASLTRTVYLDTQAPTLSIANPVNGSTQNLTPISLNGNTADNIGVSSMDYQLNGAGPVTITPPAGGSGPWSTTIPTPLSGNNTVTVHAFDRAGNLATTSVSFTYAAPTFTLSATPAAPQSVPVGQTLSYTVTATSQNSFAGSVSLAGISAPTGMVVAFANPTLTLTSGGTAQSGFTISTNSLNPGSYTVTISGTSGAKTVTDTLLITLITPPNFTLSAAANNPPPDIIAGQGITYTVSVSANDTFAGTVNFSVSGQPSGVTPVFAPTSLTLVANENKTTQLQLTTIATTTPGSYSLVISGDAGAVHQETTVALNITPPPNFSLTMSPPTQSVTGGAPATFYGGTLTSLNHFNGPVTVATTVSGAPAGIITVLSRTSVQVPDNGTGSFILNVQADHQVAGGTYLITISGTGVIGGQNVTRTTTVNLVVAEDSTAPTITAIQASPNYARVTITWLTNEPADGKIALYRDVALTDSVGEVYDPVPCSGQPCAHSIEYPSLAQTPTTYYYTVTSRDTSPARNQTVVTQQSGAPLQFTTLPAPDTTAPSLQVTSPAASLVPTSIIGQVSIAGTATDNQNMSQVMITISAQSGTWTSIAVPRTCSGLSCNFSYTWTTDASVPNGIYNIIIVATDAAGNSSPTITRQVSVTNDFSAPQVIDGPDAVVSNPCTATSCSAIITWTTDDPATSEVEFNTSLPYCTASNIDHCRVQFDDLSNGNAAALQTEHRITLTGLEPNQVYHFRITSCNGNGVCTN